MQILGFYNMQEIAFVDLGIKLFDRININSKPDNGPPAVIIRWDAKLGDSIISSWGPEIRCSQPEREVWIVTTPDVAPLFPRTLQG